MRYVYLAICQDCTPTLPQPFDNPRDRAAWWRAHRDSTGHTVLVHDTYTP